MGQPSRVHRDLASLVTAQDICCGLASSMKWPNLAVLPARCFTEVDSESTTNSCSGPDGQRDECRKPDTKCARESGRKTKPIPGRWEGRTCWSQTVFSGVRFLPWT